ncbi:MAG: DNA polymerase III subunit delta', partial [Candidatus Binatia bacterium]
MARFTDIVGQDSAVRMLREAVASGRVHHALLFSGPRGVGKRVTADALAARIFCERPAEDACGSCDSCVRLAAGTHPDLHVVEPGGDAAESSKRRTQTISIDQMRALQIALGRRPFVASRRIAIVDDAESMTIPAQNALLKTLEEPPGNTLLVLVAENAAALTATVRSRCQRVSFRPLSADAIEAALARRSVTGADARFLAEHAAGSLGRAMTLDPAKLRESL